MMKKIQCIAPLILLCPVVGFGQSFDRAAFLEAFKNRVWNNAALMGTQARPDLRLGRNGAAWTQQFANVPQLSTVLHNQKADLLFSLAAVAAEETGVPLIPPRAGWSHREGDPFVRPLVVMAGSDAASATPLSDFAFNAFALELLKAAFEKSAACTISQTSWTPEPRTAAEWGKSLCLQMNQIVAAARIEFARTATPQSERPAAVVSSPHATTLDRFRLPQDATTVSSSSGDPSRQPDPGAQNQGKESLFETRKKIQQERAIKQQEKMEREAQEQRQRAAEAQKGRLLNIA